jgi:hypothetical protein
MNEMFLFLAIGLGFLILLLRWVWQSPGIPAEGPRPSEEQVLLTTIQLELPPRALGARIFALQDWDFISASTPPEIQRIFLGERKALALSWLAETRRKVVQLMAFHRKAVRGNITLSPTLEFRLAFDYVLFLLTYEILRGLIRLRGPFRARVFVGYATSTADHFSYLSGCALSGLNPVLLNRIKDRWSGGPAAT